MNVDTYHGYFAFNFAGFDSAVRPYIMGGLGVTRFGAVDFSLAADGLEPSVV